MHAPAPKLGLLLAASLALTACGERRDPELGQLTVPTETRPQVEVCEGLSPGSGVEKFVQTGGVLTPNSFRFTPAKLAFPGRGPRLPPATLTRAFANLTLQRPVHLASPRDGSDRIFVVEQDGRILVFPNQDTVASATVCLDLRAKVSRNDEEEGLLCLAFPADFVTSQQAYVFYTTTGTTQRNVVSRFTIGSNPDQLDPASELVVLQVDQPFANHRGGMIAFGPDGMLYVGLGDGGAQGDPLSLAQDLTKLSGKVLRIDVRQATPQQPYRVPADNPFVRSSSPACPEIWAYGFRNPWRFAFEPWPAGRLWVGDVGQSTREEIDLVTKGGNYGWSFFEGSRPYRSGARGDEFYVPPLLEYSGGQGRCVIGGVVYSGPAAPYLTGKYVFGDYWSGRIWALTEYQGKVASQVEIATLPQLCSFGTDELGELYAISLQGGIYRFGPGTKHGEGYKFPTLLSTTGLFADLSTLRPAPGVLAFDINSPLWSDGAQKTRWIAPVAARSITFDPTESWGFATGTVLVKHFEMEMVRGDPKSSRRLETRVLIKEEDGWAGYCYRWNQQQTDAELLPDAADETLTILDSRDPYFSLRQVWSYPSGSDCLLCHNPSGGEALGPRTLQANRTVRLLGFPVDQLQLWDFLGLFTAPIGSTSAYQRLADPSDKSAALEPRARSYLAANCCYCHNPGTRIPGNLDLRPLVPTANMNAVLAPPVHSTLGLPNSHIITPKARASSVLWERLRRVDDYRMPPLGSHVVDAGAADLIGAWIDSLR